MSATQTAKKSAICGTALIILSGITYIIVSISVYSGLPNHEDYINGRLNTTFQQKRLSEEFDAVGAEVFLSFAMVLGTLVIMHTIWTLKRLYASERSSLHSIGWLSFVVAVIFAFLNFLQIQGFRLGARSVYEMIEDSAITADNRNAAGDLVYDQIAIKSLYVTLGVVAQGGDLLAAFELLMFSFSIGCFSYLSVFGTSAEEQRISRAHGIFGFVVAVSEFVIFFLLLILFTLADGSGKLGFGIFLGVLGSIHGYILFPIWVIWLGFQLSSKTLPDKYSNPATNLMPTAGDSSTIRT